MKRITYLWTLALAAIMAFTFTACGDDDDDEPKNGGNIDKGQYTFTINGETYYYGMTYTWPGLDEKQSTIYASFNTFGAYGTQWATLVLDAQDQPYKAFDSDGNPIVEQDYNSQVECYFNIKNFNPTTAKRGDAITFSQAVKQVTNASYYDVQNIIRYREKAQGDYDITYSWNGNAVGSAKFVSYEETEDEHHLLTLEFNKLTMVKASGDNSSFSNKTEQLVLDGKVTFTDNLTGVIE